MTRTRGVIVDVRADCQDCRWHATSGVTNSAEFVVRSAWRHWVLTQDPPRSTHHHIVVRLVKGN